MSKLTTLLLAAACPNLTVMTPEGAGRLTNIRVTGAPMVTVKLEKGGSHTCGPEHAAPVLKGFNLFRAEVLDGTSQVIDRIIAQVTPVVAPHTLYGQFYLPINFDMSRPCIETPLEIQGSDVVQEQNIGRLRITEDLRLFWQPTNYFNETRGDKFDVTEFGWVPLHVLELREFLLGKGYAAELPESEYLTPFNAEILRGRADMRHAYFYGANLN